MCKSILSEVAVMQPGEVRVAEWTPASARMKQLVSAIGGALEANPSFSQGLHWKPARCCNDRAWMPCGHARCCLQRGITLDSIVAAAAAAVAIAKAATSSPAWTTFLTATSDGREGWQAGWQRPRSLRDLPLARLLRPISAINHRY
jgi:hypothetical protein